VVCQVDAPLNRSIPPAANTLTTLDSAGLVGHYSSVTIGADGLGLISYFAGGDLKVAHCDNLACTGATRTILDSAGYVGLYTAITIGADGLGLISYHDFDNGDLKVAHCNDLACTGATLTTVDSTGHVGWLKTSITIGADGRGLISYYDATNYDLKVAHCDDLACTSATVTTLDSAGDVGMYASIATGADGLGLISYYDQGNGDLKVAHCDDLACTSATITIVDSSATQVGWHTSITIGADGLGLISYYYVTNHDLKVAHCDDLACTSATLTTLDSAGDVGHHTSITIGADGLGLIRYRDDTNGDVKVAHCSDIPCTSATLTIVDTVGSTGGGPYGGITIGADGLGLISYIDFINYDLKVAHCSNPFCVPYWRRR